MEITRLAERQHGVVSLPQLQLLGLSRSAVRSRSPAALVGIRPDNRAKTDVTVPSRSARSRPGIDVHTTTLVHADVTTVDGIPSRGCGKREADERWQEGLRRGRRSGPGAAAAA